MSEWKNPSFPTTDKKWNTPLVEDHADDDVRNIAIIIGLALKMLIGAIALVGINALLLFTALHVLSVDVEYYKCVLVSAIYIVFRAYDRATLSKLSE